MDQDLLCQLPKLFGGGAGKINTYGKTIQYTVKSFFGKDLENT